MQLFIAYCVTVGSVDTYFPIFFDKIMRSTTANLKAMYVRSRSISNSKFTMRSSSDCFQTGLDVLLTLDMGQNMLQHLVCQWLMYFSMM